MTGNLRRQKHVPVRKVRVGEFHKLAAQIHIVPFILHSASIFCLVLFQGGSRHFASAVSGFYSQMSQIEGGVGG